MRRKGFIAAAMIGVTAVLLAACGGGSSTPGSSNSGGSGDGVELRWWLLTQDETEIAALDQAVNDFEAANPGTTVKIEQRATDAHKDAIRTTSGTDAAPDIFYYWTGPGLGGEVVNSGASLDISKYYDQYKWNDRFAKGTLEQITQYGGHHGVPWTQRGEALYYNKELFAKAGITETPSTYEDLVADAQKLKDAGIDPITFGGTVNWHLMRLLDSIIETKCGADIGDKLNHLEGDWSTEPCVTESFTELKKWTDNYVAEGFIGTAATEAQASFFSGQVAMALEGDWFIQQLIDNGMDPANVGVFQFPTGTDRLYGFSEGQYVGANTKHPDEAAKFLDFLTSTETQTKFGDTFGPVSVNTAVPQAPDQPQIGTDMAGFITGATDYYLNNDQNLPLDVTTEYWRIQNGVVGGQITPEEAGSQLQTFIASHK